MLRKTMLLGVMAAVLAIPASAAAYEWLDEGLPLEGEAEMVAEGSFNTNPRIDCPAAKVEILIDGDEGTVTAFSVEDATKKCKTTGVYAMLGCKVKEVIPDNMPWKLEIDDESAYWYKVKVTHKLEDCMVSTLSVEGDLTATPDSTSAITAFELSGTLSDGMSEVPVEGEMEVTPSGTYGIG